MRYSNLTLELQSLILYICCDEQSRKSVLVILWDLFRRNLLFLNLLTSLWWKRCSVTLVFWCDLDIVVVILRHQKFSYYGVLVLGLHSFPVDLSSQFGASYFLVLVFQTWCCILSFIFPTFVLMTSFFVKSFMIDDGLH